MSFRALVSTQGADRKVTSAVETLDESKLPAGDVTVAVEYSTLNYKDGLVLTSGGGLVKTWPHVGGIDFAGTVEASSHAGFKAGDKVVLNGYRVGELHWGGYATKARVKGDWLVKLPAGAVRSFSRSGKRSTGMYGVRGTPENMYMKQLTGATRAEWSSNWRMKGRRTLPRKCTYRMAPR